jgi:hypothetical protein
MSKLGERLIKSAEEALAIARNRRNTHAEPEQPQSRRSEQAATGPESEAAAA